jgi:hypothetical protein
MDRPAGLRLILAVVFLTAIGGPAAIADCSPAAPAKPVITINAPPVVYDTSMNRAAIKQREMQVNRRRHSEADIVLGTTETEILPQAQVQIAARPLGDGTFCATIVSLKTVIDWKLVVHVASELEPGSCMYNVVMTHEQGHVDIANGLKGRALDLIGGALAAIAREGAAAKTPDAAYQMLQRAGAAALNGAMAKLNAEMDRRQAAHDTPEEYGKGRKACGLVAYYHALGR